MTSHSTGMNLGSQAAGMLQVGHFPAVLADGAWLTWQRQASCQSALVLHSANCRTAKTNFTQRFLRRFPDLRCDLLLIVSESRRYPDMGADLEEMSWRLLRRIHGMGFC